MDIYNNLNVAGDVKANKVNLSDRVVVSVDGITNGGLQYCFPACSGTIATQSYVDEKTCGIVIDAYTKAEVDEKVNCLEGSIASVETDVSNKASQFSLTCHESKVGGSSQIGHVKVASSFGSAETCVVPSLSLVCSTFGGYVTTTCLNAYKNTTTCNFNFIAGCIEGVRCYVADVESDLTTAKQNIQQNASDIASLQASSGCLENVYTKTQVDDLLANKANCSDIPDISGKADKATTLAGYGITNAYTKTEVEGLISSIPQGESFCTTNVSHDAYNLELVGCSDISDQKVVINLFGCSTAEKSSSAGIYIHRHCATDLAINTNATIYSGCFLGSGFCVNIANAVEIGANCAHFSNLTVSSSGTASYLGCVSLGEDTSITTKQYVNEQVSGKADKATTLAGYGITDAYTKSEIDNSLLLKANKSEIPDISTKADSATTLSGYGITNAYTKSEVDGIVSSLDIPDAFCSKNTEYPVENFTFKATDTSGDLSGQAVYIGCTSNFNTAVLFVHGCIKSDCGIETCGLRSDSITTCNLYSYSVNTCDLYTCTICTVSLSGCSLYTHNRPTIDGCVNCLAWNSIACNALVTKKDVSCFVAGSGLGGNGFCGVNKRYCACNLVFTTAFSPYCTVTIGCSRNSTALTVCGQSYFSCRPGACNIEVWDAICSSSLITKKDVASYVESKLSGASSSNICGLSSSEYRSLVSSGSVKANTLYVIV